MPGHLLLLRKAKIFPGLGHYPTTGAVTPTRDPAYLL